MDNYKSIWNPVAIHIIIAIILVIIVMPDQLDQSLYQFFLLPLDVQLYIGTGYFQYFFCNRRQPPSPCHHTRFCSFNAGPRQSWTSPEANGLLSSHCSGHIASPRYYPPHACIVNQPTFRMATQDSVQILCLSFHLLMQGRKSKYFCSFLKTVCVN